MNRFTRVIDLFGRDIFHKIQKTSLIILGVGGVGSYCLECLYRSGIGDITIVDFDRYDITNQNRQIGSQYIGEFKTEVLKKIYPGIKTINTKITPQWIKEFDFKKFDLILDAMDDVLSKVELIKKEHKMLITSMGSANKSDPTQIEVASIWKTYNDPLAKSIRQKLKKEKWSKNVKTIFSKEPIDRLAKGSFMGVTASFGLVMCSESIKIIKSKG